MTFRRRSVFASNEGHKINQRVLPESRGESAFPHDCNPPTTFYQRTFVPLITRHVRLEFCPPKLRARRRCAGICAFGMAVPEATVNKYRDSPPRQNDVGRAGHRADIQTKSKACSVQCLPNCQLRLGVPPADRGHHPRSRLGRNDICHVIGALICPWRDLKASV